MRLFFVLILTSSLFSCETPSQKSSGNDASLIGSWRLIADQEIDSSGMVKIQDRNVSGLIIYTSEGKMSSQILWRGTRNKIITDSIMDSDGISDGVGLGSNTWTIDESRTIIDTYDAYFGDYSVDWQNHVVTHAVAGNLRPERVGTIYKRKFRLKGDTLFLRSADPKMKWQVAWVRNIK